MTTTIYLATDHAGLALKDTVKEFLQSKETYQVIDCGAEVYDADDDYPQYISQAAEAVSKNPNARAIIFGGSGQGEAIVANKYRGVRAVVYYGGAEDIINLSREHNDANILSIGARFVTEEAILPLITNWLQTPFTEDARHVRRLTMFKDLGS